MAGPHSYTLVLTHDIDVISLREVPVTSRTFWGFAHRGIISNARRVLARDLSLVEYGRSVGWSVLSLAVKTGLVPDPWLKSFQRMIAIERAYGVRSTLFLISRPATPGHVRSGVRAPTNRAAYYRLEEWRDFFRELHEDGWELALHGLDCHLGEEEALAEANAFHKALGIRCTGLRMHWLYSSASLRTIARKAGLAYDATLGWNDRIGFPEGRLKPFIDGGSGLPVVPLNVQDGALLDSSHQGLRREDAWRQVSQVISKVRECKGTLTVLWHSNSFGPPRLWDNLYVRLLEQAIADNARIVRVIDVVKELPGYGTTAGTGSANL